QALHVVIPGKVEQTVIGNLVISVAGAWWVTGTANHALEWLPYAVAGGVVVHILGDWLTVGGVPVPLTWVGGHSVRLSASLFKTGAKPEHVLATMFGIAAIVLVVVFSAAAGLRGAGDPTRADQRAHLSVTPSPRSGPGRRRGPPPGHIDRSGALVRGGAPTSAVHHVRSALRQNRSGRTRTLRPRMRPLCRPVTTSSTAPEGTSTML
ncbi:MAG: hypothetical protein PGN11_05065, partial [Quadrisphaera sp.]